MMKITKTLVEVLQVRHGAQLSTVNAEILAKTAGADVSDINTEILTRKLLSPSLRLAAYFYNTEIISLKKVLQSANIKTGRFSDVMSLHK